ncbi:MAG: hypothetical protein EZS28_051068, partial [Streblomastix strix]
MTQWKYDQLSPEQHLALDDLITDSKTMNEDDIRRILVSEHQMQENEDEIPNDDQESRARVVLAQLREAGFMKSASNFVMLESINKSGEVFVNFRASSKQLKELEPKLQ